MDASGPTNLSSHPLMHTKLLIVPGLQHITESHYLPPRATEIMVLCLWLCPSSDLDSAGLRDLVALL